MRVKVHPLSESLPQTESTVNPLRLHNEGSLRSRTSLPAPQWSPRMGSLGGKELNPEFEPFQLSHQSSVAEIRQAERLSRSAPPSSARIRACYPRNLVPTGNGIGCRPVYCRRSAYASHIRAICTHGRGSICMDCSHVNVCCCKGAHWLQIPLQGRRCDARAVQFVLPHAMASVSGQPMDVCYVCLHQLYGPKCFLQEHSH